MTRLVIEISVNMDIVVYRTMDIHCLNDIHRLNVPPPMDKGIPPRTLVSIDILGREV